MYHRIPSTLTSKKWVVSRFYWQGISEISFQQLLEPKSSYELVVLGIRALSSTLRNLAGEHVSLRKTYWHYRSRKDYDHFMASLYLGRAKQCFVEACSRQNT